MIREVEKLSGENIYLEMTKLEQIGNKAVRQAMFENRKLGLDIKLNQLGLFFDKAVKLTNLCLAHNVHQLFAFGSVVTSKFNEQSDMDFLVKFEEVDPIDYADNYFELKFELEKLLQREVDLLEEQAIRNSNLRKNIDATKKLVYERGS